MSGAPLSSSARRVCVCMAIGSTSTTIDVVVAVVVRTQHWGLDAQVERRLCPARLSRAGVSIEETLGVRIPPTVGYKETKTAKLITHNMKDKKLIMLYIIDMYYT